MYPYSECVAETGVSAHQTNMVGKEASVEGSDSTEEGMRKEGLDREEAGGKGVAYPPPLLTSPAPSRVGIEPKSYQRGLRRQTPTQVFLN